MTDTNWKYAHIGMELGRFRLNGKSVWKEKWRRCEEIIVMLPHPTHPHQMHEFYIYEIGDEKRPIRFAAAEVSCNVWSFYVPA